MSNSPKDLLSQPAEQRYNYLINQIKQNEKLWTLADDVGAVMFNSEHDDCIAVWSEEALATLWCTDDWAHCKAVPISKDKWVKDWVPGLEKDEVTVLVMPDLNDEGLVIEPWEIAQKWME